MSGKCFGRAMQRLDMIFCHVIMECMNVLVCGSAPISRTELDVLVLASRPLFFHPFTNLQLSSSDRALFRPLKEGVIVLGMLMAHLLSFSISYFSSRVKSEIIHSLGTFLDPHIQSKMYNACG